MTRAWASLLAPLMKHACAGFAHPQLTCRVALFHATHSARARPRHVPRPPPTPPATPGRERTNSAAGASTGNPVADGLGQPTWQYEFVQVEDENQPWFAQTRQLLVWDPTFFGGRAWARSEDKPPSIQAAYFDHVQTDEHRAYIPIIRWQNPVQRQIRVQVVLDVSLLPQNVEGEAAPSNEVRLVVGHQPSTGLPPVVLYEETVVVNGTQNINIRPLPATVAPQGSVFVTVRGAGDKGWITVVDRMRVVLVGYESGPAAPSD